MTKATSTLCSEPREAYFSLRFTSFDKTESHMSFKTDSPEMVIKLATRIFARKSKIKSAIVVDQYGKNWWYSRRDVKNGKTAKKERF